MESRNMKSARVIVIGGGPCGAITARELVRRGVDVVMLDAGPKAARGVIVRAGGKTLFRWVDNRYWRTERQQAFGHREVEWHSSRSLGGLSNYWTSAVPRFAPEDFVESGSLGQEYEWPIRYDDVEPYYSLVETALSITGRRPSRGGSGQHPMYPARFPRDWAEIANQVVSDVIEPMPMAVGRPWMVARRGTGFNSYHCIVRDLEGMENFRLHPQAMAFGIRWSAADGRATGVDYVDGVSGAKVFAGADAVVVTAGAIDSTQLLLRSRSEDFPHGLGNTNDVLGRYLHDHPRQWWPVQLSKKLTALTHPLYIARPPFVEGRPLDGYSMTIGLAGGADRARALLGARVDRVGVQVFGTMIPRVDSTVALAPGEGLDAAPTITFDYQSSADAQMQRARERFVRMFDAAGIVAAPIEPFHDLQPGSSIHFGGTVRMHADPQFGMIDGWNRIHAVPNVVVSDMSAFTTSPEKNPTLTAMAIAARAAQHLAGGLGASGAIGDPSS
jgi:choline dehydrogenase-like flavoprotein